MWPVHQFPVGLVTFTEEILSAKILFLCSARLFSQNPIDEKTCSNSTIQTERNQSKLLNY